VSLAALLQFLTFHGEIGYVEVCTDNDETGDTCAAQIDGLKKARQGNEGKAAVWQRLG
jgi:hypothetical protein